MKSKRSLVTTSFAGVVLVLTIATSAAPLSCVACEVSTSYHAAVRAYDRARAWGTIIRWWVDPVYAAPESRVRDDKQTTPKTEDICQARPSVVQMK